MSVFVGYPAQPTSLPEVYHRVADRKPAGYEITTWESLETAGRVVMRSVLDAIEDADFCVFDLTFPNPNVLFEAGFAITRGKCVWLTVDVTRNSSRKHWQEISRQCMIRSSSRVFRRG